MVMLERTRLTMLRLMPSGRVASCISAPMVTIQAGPSGTALTSRGRSSLRRTTVRSSRRMSVVRLMLRLVSSSSAASPTDASVSNTSQSVSARTNMAAGVDVANGNVRLTLSLWRLSETLTAAPADGGAAGLGLPASAGGAAAADARSDGEGVAGAAGDAAGADGGSGETAGGVLCAAGGRTAGAADGDGCAGSRP